MPATTAKAAKSLGFGLDLELDQAAARERTIEALKEQGFGVLTEIDVKTTMKEKLDIDFRPYTILGACNPPLAHRALSNDLDIGLMLPCNVIIYESEPGHSRVEFMDPVAALGIVENEELGPIAREAYERLHAVMHTLQADDSGGGFRFPVDRLHLLKDPERREKFPPEPILKQAGVTEGDRVADVGAGAGFWTLPLSRLVGPKGRVFAVDIEPVMLDELRNLVRDESLENVEVVPTGDELVVPLPDGTVAMALLGFVLHEPKLPAVFLREVLRVLQPAGRILVVDWQKWETESGPPVGHRISESQAVTMIRDIGLQVEPLDSPSPDVYILLGSSPG